jgi:HAD superfamily hydrolase (TIGR01544 family)
MSSKNVLIKDLPSLEKKISKMKKGGASMLHVISDFDRTLTMMAKGGYAASASYDPISQGLGTNFEELTKQMTAHYIPIELSKTHHLRVKIKKMTEWWDRYYEEAVKHGMHKGIITDALKQMKASFRQGSAEFFSLLSKNKVPLLIFSAGTGDIICECLKAINQDKANVHVISNFFEFDKKGRAIGYNKPLIHTYNKNESHLKGSAYKNTIAKRKNVILLGDSLGDPDMAKGMGHECLIKIGFYNHAKDNDLVKKYLKGYDLLIMGNGDMSYVNKLLREIING